MKGQNRFNSTATEQINKDEKKRFNICDKQFENIAKELLMPTYTSSPEDELLKRKNENLDKMENQEKTKTRVQSRNVIKNTIKTMAWNY